MNRDDEILEEYSYNIFRYVGFFAKWLSPGLYTVFLIADYVIMPEEILICALIRFCMIPISFFVTQALAKHHKFTVRQNIAFWYVVANGTLLLPLTYMSGGFNSNYFAGLMLVLVGGLGFLPFQRSYTIAMYLVLLLPYYVTCFLKSGYGEASLFKMATNSLFLGSAAVLSAFVRLSFRRYEAYTITQRQLLQRSKAKLEEQTEFLEILNRDLEASKASLQKILFERERVIEEETEENLRLHFLKNHFSPQVIQHLKDRSRDSKSRIEVCVIFIDIVNSTNRINSIDEFEFNKVISIFIDQVTRILLINNITIDKFVGDGIIAYANHPVNVSDYLDIACKASLEVRDYFQENQKTIAKHWQDDFQIRIGLANGVANIGSFGSLTQHYTGIGGVFNLSQRVCAAADPGTILVAADVFENLSFGKFECEKSEPIISKGFKETVQVYELKGFKSEKSSLRTCPNGHGYLKLTTRNGFYFGICEVCGYSN